MFCCIWLSAEQNLKSEVVFPFLTLELVSFPLVFLLLLLIACLYCMEGDYAKSPFKSRYHYLYFWEGWGQEEMGSEFVIFASKSASADLVLGKLLDLLGLVCLWKWGMTVFLFMTSFWVQKREAVVVVCPCSWKQADWEDPRMVFWNWRCAEGLQEWLSAICDWLLWRLVLHSRGRKLPLDTKLGTMQGWVHCHVFQWPPCRS